MTERASAFTNPAYQWACPLCAHDSNFGMMLRRTPTDAEYLRGVETGVITLGQRLQDLEILRAPTSAVCDGCGETVELILDDGPSIDPGDLP